MNNEIKTISPFRNFCITIGALPTSYLESMSYYEMLCWLCKYLENTINPAINNNAEALKELQEYVANYFDNLDVQTEINNKLDEMADDGTLAEIINVEMIGSLQNLTTTDKSNVVNAVNETNYKINKLNLVTFTNFTIDQFQINNASLTYGGLSTAENSTHDVCKVYGIIRTDTSQSANLMVTIRLQTTLRPETDININGSVLMFLYTSGTLSTVTQTHMKIKTDGVIEIAFEPNEIVTGVDLYLPPCLYFLKDFGD